MLDESNIKYHKIQDILNFYYLNIQQILSEKKDFKSIELYNKMAYSVNRLENNKYLSMVEDLDFSKDYSSTDIRIIKDCLGYLLLNLDYYYLDIYERLVNLRD